MTLDELLENWKADAEIDRTELGNEAIKIPQLHSKYFKFYSTERLALRKLEEDAKVLKKQKYEWFNGSMDYEDLNDLGWSPNPLKLLRADIPQYIDADKDIVSLNLKIAYAKEKVDFLDSAIRSLNTRGYNLRAAIDWEKFKMGGI
tara:strand:- start:378 stop:815 length:438 start_codon:yes stop_codon:yes gene_type:complete